MALCAFGNLWNDLYLLLPDLPTGATSLRIKNLLRMILSYESEPRRQFIVLFNNVTSILTFATELLLKILILISL